MMKATRVAAMAVLCGALGWLGCSAADPPKTAQRTVQASYRVRDEGLIKPLWAQNLAQGLRIHFDAERLTLQANAGSGWTLGLRLARWGRGATLAEVPIVRARRSRGDRVEYERGTGTTVALVEWYVNRPEGLEQGFELRERPGARTVAGEMVLELALSGDLRPALAADGAAVLLRDAQGRTAARYHALHVWDARKRVLPARLAVSGDALHLRIDDADATYPLTIDPLVSTERSLTLTNGGAGDSFGTAVDLSGSLSVIGAPKRPVALRTGRVQADWPTLDCGASCTIPAGKREITPTDAPELFGRAVAYDGDDGGLGSTASVVVGAQGAAYVFVRQGTASIINAYAQQQKLTGSVGFGISVDISGDTLVVGEYTALPFCTHSKAHVYVRSGTSWSLQQTITSSALGVKVALDGDTLVIGSTGRSGKGGCGWTGRVLIYVRSGGSWTLQQSITALNPQEPDSTGQSVALHGDTLVIGDYGAAHVYRRAGTTWTLEKTHLALSSAATADFGKSVALRGATLVVGDPGDSTKGAKTGAIYVFIRGVNGWEQRGKLLPNGVAAGDAFGSAVAASPKTVLGGAPTAASRGDAYAFDLLLANDGATCTTDDQCYGHHCADGVCCGELCGLCEACNLAGKLGTCGFVGAGSDPKKQCASGQTCDGAGKCVKITGETCIVSGDCLSKFCVDATCCTSACQETCKRCDSSAQPGTCSDVPAGQPDLFASTLCTAGMLCDGGGVCKKGLGASCAGAAECHSGFCTDGVCCDKACDTTCFACTLALNGKDDGTCASVRQYTPDLVASTPCDDSGNKVCDGDPVAPQCIVKPGGLCGPQGQCATGQYCVDGICCSSPCDAVCKICKLVGNVGSCVDMDKGLIDDFPINACSGQQRCDGFGQCKQLQGESCGGQSECLAGFCVDGVCCETECKGVCESCALPGQVGTCQAIAANTDPATECLGTSPQCGGLCTGKRSCDFPGAGTGCGLCRACDGTGQCTATPEDDPSCGTLDCDALDSACRDYVDIKSKRCVSFGKCKAANVPETCLVFAETCGDAGPTKQDSGPAKADSGPVVNPEAGAKSDSGVVAPPADGGCGCRAAGSGLQGSLWSLLLALGLALSRRRRRGGAR